MYFFYLGLDFSTFILSLNLTLRLIWTLTQDPDLDLICELDLILVVDLLLGLILDLHLIHDFGTETLILTFPEFLILFLIWTLN